MATSPFIVIYAVKLPRCRLLGSQRDFTCLVTPLIKHIDYFRCAIPPQQAHFCMFSPRRANTSGSQMFTAEMEEVVPIVHLVADGRIDWQLQLQSVARLLPVCGATMKNPLSANLPRR